ncbi:MAG TPA: hypothetical protein VFW77_02200 [Candidatus Saccharimonadales bacterium]|nr:hypothetical protein [Candidatus Saccharimonadales bacterium]
MKDIDIKAIPVLAKEYLRRFLKHAKFIFIILILCLSAFLIFEINRLTSKEPSDIQVLQQQQIIKRPRIDQDTIDKIERLKDQNVRVQSLFKAARDNPFSD